MWTSSIWAKSTIGFLLGFLLSMSTFMNVGFAVPMPRDVFLLIAVMGGFTLWSIIISWFYCVESLKKPAWICLGLFFLTAGINAYYYTMGSA